MSHMTPKLCKNISRSGCEITKNNWISFGNPPQKFGLYLIHFEWYTFHAFNTRQDADGPTNERTDRELAALKSPLERGL